VPVGRLLAQAIQDIQGKGFRVIQEQVAETSTQ